MVRSSPRHLLPIAVACLPVPIAGAVHLGLGLALVAEGLPAALGRPT